MARKPYFSNDCGSIYIGYCEDSLPNLEEDSVDLCVTDPPYGYSFMGKKWDIDVPSVQIWREVLRVLKPGAFAFIMSAPRSDVYTKMVQNIAAAGFQINYSPIFWAYNSGFPKSASISRAIDKRFGCEGTPVEIPNKQKSALCWGDHYENRQEVEFTEPTSPMAKKFKGAYSGYTPRPAVEIVIVAMKPIKKTHVDQALENGKGVTWLGDCHIPTQNGSRFAANLIAEEGVFSEGGYNLDSWAKLNISNLPIELQNTFPFLFVPKPVKSEKELGCEDLEDGKWVENTDADSPISRAGKKRKNIHPTVKPLKLFSYLITLGSRKGDIVLDPFLGSGTAALAAEIMGRNWIGCELMQEYVEVAVSRISTPRRKMKDLSVVNEIKDLRNSEAQLSLSAYI